MGSPKSRNTEDNQRKTSKNNDKTRKNKKQRGKTSQTMTHKPTSPPQGGGRSHPSRPGPAGPSGAWSGGFPPDPGREGWPLPPPCGGGVGLCVMVWLVFLRCFLVLLAFSLFCHCFWLIFI